MEEIIDDSLRVANNAHSSLDLQELFSYDVVSGVLTWKVSKGRAKPGDVAGTQHNKGYLSAEVDGTAYLVHRLAWCMYFGEWPNGFIDHVNLDKQDNRIENLRIAYRSSNNCNQFVRADNTSGVKGVSWHARVGKWQARVQVRSKRTHIGYFDSLEQAEQAAIAVRSTQHKEFANHG
jgi:hypothetical protein